MNVLLIKKWFRRVALSHSYLRSRSQVICDDCPKGVSSRRSMPGNPDDLTVSALATGVNDSDRGRTQLAVLDAGDGAGRSADSGPDCSGIGRNRGGLPKRSRVRGKT